MALGVCLILAACDSRDERVQRHYENGLRLAEAGELQKAALEFQNAASLDITFAPALFELAKIHEANRDMSRAISNYFKTIELDPNHVEALTRSANILILANELERARSNIDIAFRLEPKNPEVLLTRSLINLRQSKHAEALADAQASLRLDPANAKAGLIIASEQQRTGQMAEAAATLDRFLEVNPNDISLNVFKIRVLDQMGDKQALNAHLRHLIEIYPNSLEVRRVLAKWYLAEKQYPEAEVELRKLRELQPQSMEAIRNLIQFISDTKGETAAREEIIRQIGQTQNAAQRVPLQTMLAEIDYNDGRTKAAYDTLDTVLASEAAEELKIDAQLLYGQLRAREGDLAAALDLANAALEVDGKNAAALGLRAAVYSEQGLHEQAVITVRAALNESPRSAKLRRLASQIYARNGNLDLSGESLATAVVLSQYDPLYVREYVELLRRADQGRAIAAVLSEAVRRHPQNRDLLAALAAARLRLQDWAGAEQVAAQLRETDSTDADKIRAVILSGQQRYGESIELMQRLAADRKDDGALMAALVQIYVKTGLTSQARAYIDKVIEEDPRNPHALRLSGALYQLSDEQAAAEEAFRRAVLANPQDSVSYVVLSRYLRAHDRAGEAEEVVRGGLANNPGSVTLHVQLADLLLQRGNYEAAIEQFEVVYDLQPESLSAANNLASILADFHANNPDLVDRAYRIAQRLAGSADPHHMDTYGWILYLRGNYAQALRSLVPAAQQLPESPWTQYHTGMTYLKLNRHEEARRYLQAALETGGADMFPLRQQAEEALASLNTQ